MGLPHEPSYEEEELWFLSRDPEADRWGVSSYLGFCLRHPDALDANFLRLRQELKDTWRLFRRYGQELHILEHDLAECVNELLMAYRTYYPSPEQFGLKKFAIMYHTDNFYVRVHKLLENVYRLLALVAGLDLGDKRPPDKWKQEVKDALTRLGLQEIVERLRAFEHDKRIKEAVGARNLFVHLYRDEPWPSLTPEGRLREDDYEDPMAMDVRRMTEEPELERYKERKASDLSRTLDVIRDFRDELCSLLRDKVLETPYCRQLAKTHPESHLLVFLTEMI